MSNLTVIEKNQAALKKEAEALKPYALRVLKDNKKIEQFMTNITELATNDYLLNEVNKRQIIKLAIDLSAQGFNINPRYKQLSIVPFAENGMKDKIPSPIIHLKGWQEVLFNGGFMLTVDNIWKINGAEKRESEMTFEELSKIDETDEIFRKEHFLGFYVILEDLRKEIPIQKKYVSFSYTLKAVKNMQVPKEFLLNGLIHKAVRKALSTMVVPQSRVFLLEEDYSNLPVEADKSQPKEQPKTNDPMELLKQQEQKQDEPIDTEATDKGYTEEELVQRLRSAYKQVGKEDKVIIMKVVQYQGDDRLDVLKEECERLKLC